MRRRFRQGKARCAATSRAARDDRPVTADNVNARSEHRPCLSSSWVARRAQTLAAGGPTRKAASLASPATKQAEPVVRRRASVRQPQHLEGPCGDVSEPRTTGVTERFRRPRRQGSGCAAGGAGGSAAGRARRRRRRRGADRPAGPGCPTSTPASTARGRRAGTSSYAGRTRRRAAHHGRPRQQQLRRFIATKREPVTDVRIRRRSDFPIRRSGFPMEKSSLRGCGRSGYSACLTVGLTVGNEVQDAHPGRSVLPLRSRTGFPASHRSA